MRDGALRKQRDVVFVDGFREGLAEIEVEGRAGVGLHDVVAYGSEEFHRGQGFGCACLGEDAEVDGGFVLVLGVREGGAVEGEGESGKVFDVWSEVVAGLGFQHGGFGGDVEACEEVVDFRLVAARGCEADFGCGG